MQEYVATAFLSCSLRVEDLPFVEYISRILKAHGIKPDGTIGRYYAAPENVSTSMKNQIENCDLIVIAATPRYFTEDVHNKRSFKSMSEQLHAEAGIADGLNKPIVVFVQEGTEPGNYLSSVTQYVVLNGSLEDYERKKTLILSLLNNAYNKVQNLSHKRDFESLKSTVVGGLAIFGFLKLMQYLIESDD